MLSWFGFVVVALGSYRLTRFFTRDSLTDRARDRLYSWAWDDEDPVQGVDESGDAVWEPRARSTFRSYAYELLTCSWCLGIWITAAVYSLWRWADSSAVEAIIVILAAAGVQGFVASRYDA